MSSLRLLKPRWAVATCASAPFEIWRKCGASLVTFPKHQSNLNRNHPLDFLGCLSHLPPRKCSEQPISDISTYTEFQSVTQTLSFFKKGLCPSFCLSLPLPPLSASLAWFSVPGPCRVIHAALVLYNRTWTFFSRISAPQSHCNLVRCLTKLSSVAFFKFPI